MTEVENLETRFENITAVTPDAARAMVWQISRRDKAAWIKMAIICAIIIGLSVFYFIRGMALLGVLFLILAFVMPLRTVFSVKRQSQKLYESLVRLTPQKEMQYLFTNKSFTRNHEKVFAYSQPSEIAEDARYFYVFFGESALFIDKFGFTKGNPQAFLAFFQERLAEAALSAQGAME